MSSERTTAEVQFVRSGDYRVYPATGAWGGVSPTGDIVADFYVEKRQNPDKLFLEFEGEEQTGERREPAVQPFVREVLFGIVFKPETARAVGEFLIGFADKAIGKKKG